MSMQINQSGFDALNGLSLGDAFRRCVLEDGEVAAIGNELCAVDRSASAVFRDGNYPGEIIDYHWPVHVNAENISYAFTSSMLVLLDRPLPEPSELQVSASKLLASRLSELIAYLLRGEMIAIGTFGATGVETSIGIGQWRRSDLSIDVHTNSVCETRDHKYVPLWTGVWLRIADQTLEGRGLSLVDQPKSSRKLIQTKITSRDQLLLWLRSLTGDVNSVPLTRAELWQRVKEKWPGTISQRECDKCRDLVLGGLSEDDQYRWKRPGPRSKS